jgi:type I restriction enzyme S subunit
VIDGLQPYPEMKPSGLPWLGHVPRHWDVRRAKRIFKPTEIPVRPNDDIVTCFRDGQVTLRKNRRSNGFMLALLEQGYQGVRVGQLVVHSMDAFAGAIGISDSDGKCTPEYIVCNPRDQGTLLPYYAWLLRHVARTKYILAAYPAVRERAPRLRYPDLGELKLPAPPLDEQRLIVRFLDWHGAQTANLIRSKLHQLELIAEQRERVTQEIISSPGTNFMRFEVTTDNMNRLIDRDQLDRYTPVGLFNRGRGIFKKETTTGGDLGDSAFQWIEDGDLIISGQFAWEGAVALVGADETGCIASHRYHVLRARKGIADTVYILAFLRTRYGQLILDHHLRGAAGRNRPLNLRTLLKETIHVPPLNEQRRLVELIGLERAVSASITKLSNSLREFRARLIAEVVTGKLDVRSAANDLPDMPETTPLDEAISDADDEDIDATEDEEVAA